MVVTDLNIGGDLDEYGCKASAGFSWCASLNSCVQVWITPCTDDVVVVPLATAAPVVVATPAAGVFATVDGLDIAIVAGGAAGGAALLIIIIVVVVVVSQKKVTARKVNYQTYGEAVPEQVESPTSTWSSSPSSGYQLRTSPTNTHAQKKTTSFKNGV